MGEISSEAIPGQSFSDRVWFINPIRVRYLREFREDIPELEKILVPSSTGAQIPLAQVLTIKSVLGPQEIKGERGLLVGYVTMNTRDRDEVSVVEDAEALLQGECVMAGSSSRPATTGNGAASSRTRFAPRSG